MKGSHQALFILTLAMAAMYGPAVIADDDIGRVKITLVEPENFTDVKPRYLIDEFTVYVQRRAAAYLAEGQRLAIIVTDVDMAGGFDYWLGPQFFDVRIMRDTYPPRIDLAFTLTDAGGAVISQGERRLRDLSYQMRVGTSNDYDPLVYEKQIVNEWLWREFR